MNNRTILVALFAFTNFCLIKEAVVRDIAQVKAKSGYRHPATVPISLNEKSKVETPKKIWMLGVIPQ